MQEKEEKKNLLLRFKANYELAAKVSTTVVFDTLNKNTINFI